MQFVDEVMIWVQAGAGGNGCVAFRREAHVPRGGPAGGDGGRGGDVLLVVDPALTTLLDLRYQREYRAPRGQHGQGHDRFGKHADSLVVRVPCGTLVLDADSGERLADLTDPGQQFVAAKGGHGGFGNLHFVSSTNQAPRRANPGEPGEERKLRLELKLLADAGLVGLPNAGKSTLLSRVSAARPKIADYPFTTLTPNLGVVSLGEERSFVLADIPGLMQGAHEGAGLGHRFLRHIERTRVLIFLLDDRHSLFQEPGSPLEDLRLLEEELKAHHGELAHKPAVVALNKADLLSPAEETALSTTFSAAGIPIHFISAVSGQGVRTLLEAVWTLLGRESVAEENSPSIERNSQE
jgi:GTPase